MQTWQTWTNNLTNTKKKLQEISYFFLIIFIVIFEMDYFLHINIKSLCYQAENIYYYYQGHIIVYLYYSVFSRSRAHLSLIKFVVLLTGHLCIARNN